jgi:hypothetical protein
VKSLSSLLSAFVILIAVYDVRAAEPVLKPHDVIALVGGEDMVVAGEQFGFLEFQFQSALPQLRLKVRNLAWEGDTVFEQARMLNYPKLEQQLDEIGATVVIMQFGQMECLKGKQELSRFVEAYDRLINRVRGENRHRRLVLLSPSALGSGVKAGDRVNEALNKVRSDHESYVSAIRDLAARVDATYVDIAGVQDPGAFVQRDGVHLSDQGQAIVAERIYAALGHAKRAEPPGQSVASAARLIPIIKKKNRLWDRYRRPQNWAFLAGDRITQASSRDHRDPSRRWFPEEMKDFLPIIEAADREIWDVAAKLSVERK